MAVIKYEVTIKRCVYEKRRFNPDQFSFFNIKLDDWELDKNTLTKILQKYEEIPKTHYCCYHRTDYRIGSKVQLFEKYFFKSVPKETQSKQIYYTLELTPSLDEWLYEDCIKKIETACGMVNLKACKEAPSILMEEQKKNPIEYLNVSGIDTKIRMRELFDVLAELKQLRGLSLALPWRIEGMNVQKLKALPCLEVLTLKGIAPDVLYEIREMKKLKALRLSYHNNDKFSCDDEFDFLKGMESLEYLDLWDCDLKLKLLAKPPNLKWIHVNKANAKRIQKREQKAVFAFLSCGKTRRIIVSPYDNLAEKFDFKNMNDLQNFCAICRPGPLAYEQDYLRRAPCRLPEAAGIASETHNVLIYIEQLEEALQLLTGCSPEEAAVFRKNKSRDFLVPRIAKYKNISLKDAEELYSQWSYYTYSHIERSRAKEMAQWLYSKALEYLQSPHKFILTRDKIRKESPFGWTIH